MKQTAIEWLFEQINKNTWYDESNYPQVNIGVIDFEQAKEMEKQQTEDAYSNGHNDGCRYMNNEKQIFEHEEQYYNETYNK